MLVRARIGAHRPRVFHQHLFRVRAQLHHRLVDELLQRHGARLFLAVQQIGLYPWRGDFLHRYRGAFQHITQRHRVRVQRRLGRRVHGADGHGTKPSTDDTLTMLADGCCFRCSTSADVTRTGPSRLVVMVVTAMASSITWLALSICITPALLMSTFSDGKSAISLAVTAAMLAGSSTLSCTDFMPGLAWVTSSSSAARRPEMMTWLPFLCSASAKPRPMPDAPPVMKIVLPLSFMLIPVKRGVRSDFY